MSNLASIPCYDKHLSLPLNLPIALSLFKSVSKIIGTPVSLTWPETVKKLTTFEFRNDKDVPLYSPAVYAPNNVKRQDANVIAMSAVVIDVDNDTWIVENGKKKKICVQSPTKPDDHEDNLGDIAYFWHSTHSNRPDHPKFRYILPFSRPVPPQEWAAVFAGAMALLGNDPNIDGSCKDLSRAYYLPSCPPEYAYCKFSGYHEGPFIDPDYLIELAGGCPSQMTFAPPSAGALEKPVSAGRNDTLKGIVAARIERGESIDSTVEEILNYDQKHHDPPLLSDPSEPQYAGKDPRSNALKFVANVTASINQRRVAQGLPPEGIGVALNSAPTAEKGALVFDLLSWGAERFSGEPKPIQELVKGRFRLGVPSMLAAMGDTGKGYVLLDLAFKIATSRAGNLPVEAMGGTVDTFGTSVIFSAEDDAPTFHERLHNLDPAGRRFEYPGRLITFPFPNAGGVKPFAVIDRQGFPSVTDDYHRLCDALMNLPELRLIAFDPIQAYFCFDLNKPELAQFAGSMLCALSSETGASTIAVHHMRKESDIDSPTKAREAIRGSSALVDSLRGAYALWPVAEKEGRKVMRALDRPFQFNAVVNGAVVKANGAADRRVTTYVRNEFGLLVDHTHLIKNQSSSNEELAKILTAAIGNAASEGQPFTKTGANGLHARRQELPEEFQKTGRDRLEGLCQSLLDSGAVKACLAKGSTTVKWLDVPEGPFALGKGNFKTGGASKRS